MTSNQAKAGCIHHRVAVMKIFKNQNENKPKKYWSKV